MTFKCSIMMFNNVDLNLEIPYDKKTKQKQKNTGRCKQNQTRGPKNIIGHKNQHLQNIY